MDASRLIAWVVGLVVVAAGIAVIASDTTFFQQLARLPAELPTISSHLGALVKDTRLIGWGLLSFVMMLILLWIKLRSARNRCCLRADPSAAVLSGSIHPTILERAAVHVQ